MDSGRYFNSLSPNLRLLLVVGEVCTFGQSRKSATIRMSRRAEMIAVEKMSPLCPAEA
jgi:hypothetical protein